MRLYWIGCAIFLIAVTKVGGFNEEVAGEQWAKAFLWYQTGRNLTDSGQAPLALGSYAEALKQFEALAKAFPQYEVETVTYRLNALRKDVAEMKANLSPEDLSISEKYLAFVQLVKLADEQRFASQRRDSANTLRKAKAELDAIVSLRPEAFKPAVQTQDQLLVKTIAWLDHLEKTSKPQMTFVRQSTTGSNRIKGTTEFITTRDLPISPGIAATAASLFPGK